VLNLRPDACDALRMLTDVSEKQPTAVPVDQVNKAQRVEKLCTLWVTLLKTRKELDPIYTRNIKHRRSYTAKAETYQKVLSIAY
jgi:hypothetical protein